MRVRCAATGMRSVSGSSRSSSRMCLVSEPCRHICVISLVIVVVSPPRLPQGHSRQRGAVCRICPPSRQPKIAKCNTFVSSNGHWGIT